MSTDTLAKIDHPAAWTVKSLMAQQDQWIYQLTDDDIAALDAALQQIKARGLIVPKFGTADFAMPKLAAKLKGPVRIRYTEDREIGAGTIDEAERVVK